MKIKKADIVMVAIIAAMVLLGVSFALTLRGEAPEVTAEGTTATLPGGLTGGEAVCSIEIRCDTVLNHLETLDEAKAPYVPESGVVLAKTEVSFTEGETAFDVLQRVCTEASIQLEYSWTPVYDSYYIEGINHLYEFDCGGQSGWMYKVNEVFPNYGCSGHTVQPGDEIVWCYTCDGLGTDVGAKME